MIRGKRSLRFNQWAKDVEILYANALGNEAIKACLVSTLITVKQLQATQKKFTAFMALHHDKQQQKGEAKKATQEKRGAMEAAQKKVSQFQKTLRATYLKDTIITAASR